jgi:hypothetical protein
MTALRQMRKAHRQLPAATLQCTRCRSRTPAGELVCDDCAGDQANEAVQDDRQERDREEMEIDAQRELSRVHEDLRMGRIKDAVWRLERTLDDVAPSWRELVCGSWATS